MGIAKSMQDKLKMTLGESIAAAIEKYVEARLSAPMGAAGVRVEVELLAREIDECLNEAIDTASLGTA